MNKLINKVIIEGNIVNGSFSASNKFIYFAQLKQERKMVNFKWDDYFSIYALSPLSKQLAKIVEKNPNAHVVIEGELHTKISKNKDLYTRILVNKILDVSTDDTITKNSDNTTNNTK